MLLLYLGIAFVVGTSVQAQGQRDCFIVLDQDTCPENYRCVEGQCRPDIGQPNECSMMRPCRRPNYRCVQGFCVPDTTSGCLGCQFQENVICENDRCVRRPGASCGPLYEPCSRGYSCLTGVCTANSSPRCRTNRDCSFNEQCQRGRCVPITNTPECRRDIDCPNGRCRQGTCVALPTNTCDYYRGIRCGRGYRCVNGQCLPNDEFECGPQRPCQPGYRCRMGLCVRDVNPQPTCRSNRECPPYQRCVRGNCVQRVG